MTLAPREMRQRTISTLPASIAACKPDLRKSWKQDHVNRLALLYMQCD